MKRFFLRAVSCSFMVAIVGCRLVPAQLAAGPRPGGARASADAAGHYRISLPAEGWSFGGTIGTRPTAIRHYAGHDRLGRFQAVRLDWTWSGYPVSGIIQTYAGRPLALFRLIFHRNTLRPALTFPDFRREPRGLFVMSYRDLPFSPPQFRAARSGSPWLFFNRRRDAALLSPANHFQLMRLEGDGARRSAAGLFPHIASVPAGFEMDSLLAAARGINAAYRRWGHSLTRLQGKHRPSNEADISLRDLGYWTDNGATYYYRYRRGLGYAGTLLAELRHLRRRHIPVRYLQLDSWWYQKDRLSYDGKLLPLPPRHAPWASTRHARPARWYIFGGVWRYVASRTLFPQGLAAFNRQTGVPFITHGRWISQRSPYHQRYRIAGIAPVDARYWNHIAAYLHNAGVVTYEQDWLNYISRYSGFRRLPGVGNRFFDEMSAAMARQGMTLQYCMPDPNEFLQASRYSNLTTTRVSDDHFLPARWTNFLFVSRLASALGVWPWADVTTSRDPNLILLQTLSGGPVGFGDGIGRERKRVLMQATRADGRIVKPDAAMVPVGADYIQAALGLHRPTLGRTYTDQDGVKTAYVFAFAHRPQDRGPVRFRAREIGLRGGMYVYDYFRRQGAWVPAGQAYQGQLSGPDNSAYFICATPGESGIAFLGDANQFVGTGRQRIAALRQAASGLSATVRFAPGETQVILHGYARRQPAVRVGGGTAGTVRFDSRTGLFEAIIGAPRMARPQRVRVQFRLPR